MSKQRARASLVGMAMLLITTTLAAQVTEEWVARYDGPESYDDEARSIAIDDAGNVYVTGWSGGSETSNDYATVKYSSSGTVQWVARYDGPASGVDEARDIAVDDSGNVYVTGYSEVDYATVKYSSNGEELWVARYDRPESDIAYAVAIDGAGNVYVTGYSDGSETGWDYATVKYSSSGVQQWVARYDGPASGGDGADAIAIDDAGNVYITGYSEGPGTWTDYATVKYNSSGVEQWVARYDGSASGEDHANAIAIDDAGNVYVTGWSFGSGTGDDYATVKYNPQGEEEWVARYDGPGICDKANAIAIDGAGNIYVTGPSKGPRAWWNYVTVKYNSSGVEQWVAWYDGPESEDDVANAIAIDADGNIYVTGYSYGLGTWWDYATVKYNSSGTKQWVARYESGWACAIAVDDSGNVYVTGTSGGDYATIKYSQGPGVAEAPPDVPGHRLQVAQLAPQPAITYTLLAGTRVSLKVYDVTGKLVRTLVSGSQKAGTHTTCWDARNDSNRQVSAGLYFILLETRDFRATGKLVVVR